MEADGFRNLVLRAQAGEAEAIERLFQAVSPFVEGLVRARGVRPGDSVSDHAQDSCVRILTRLEQFRGAQEVEDDRQVLTLFRAWVRLIARSVISNRERDNAVPQPVQSLLSAEGGGSTEGRGEIDPPGREPTGSANVREEERIRLIQEAVATLPDPLDGEILRRRFFEEQTLEQIATDLGLSYDQARERCRKSLKRLQPRLEGLL